MLNPRSNSRLRWARVIAFSSVSLSVPPLVYVGWIVWDRAVEYEHIAALHSGDEEARLAALKALEKRGSIRAVPDLLGTLASAEDPPFPLSDVVWCGNTVLDYYSRWEGRCDEYVNQLGSAAVPTLRKQLCSQDPIVRLWAAYLIGDVASPGHPVRDELLNYLADPDPRVWFQVARAVAALSWRHESTIEFLIAELWKSDGNSNREACGFCLTKVMQQALHWHEVASELEPATEETDEILAYLGGTRMEIERDAGRVYSSLLPVFEDLARSVDAKLRKQAILFFADLCEHLETEDEDALEDRLVTDEDTIRKALLMGLDDDDPEVRRIAAYVLGRRGEVDVSIAVHLGKALLDQDVEVREAAASSLEYAAGVDRALPFLTRALQDSSLEVRSDASVALAEVGAKAVPQLIDVLKGEDANAREAAARALAGMGGEAKAAFAALLDVLDDPRGDVNEEVSEAAGKIGAASSTGLEELLERLQSTETLVRKGAADALGHYGKTARAAAPQLFRAMDDDDPSVQAEATFSLMRVGGFAVEPFREKVVRLFRGSSSPDVRFAAVYALRKLGSEAVNTVPCLREALTDAYAPVRWTAARALGYLGSAAAPAIPELTVAVKDNNSSVSENAVIALGRLGPAAGEAVSTLVEALDREPECNRPRGDIVEALGRIGHDPERVVPPLIEELKAEDDYCRELAVDALVRFGAPAVPHLREAWRSEEATVRQAASKALRQIELRDERAELQESEDS